ncbi:aldehyde dehydrogenase (NADP(+)) [Vibrio nigripulchritudo]|uniref:aldehyde dehydrogenase (NADP(+)) n=1 Tax=Vibrio nigripulchritudo TaxID=28173 RepID=UPI00248FFFA0|nr:aldehyde dehydrogenase (NADP(+)) [Vibrio nigripulchritudo]BDU37367.1 aldehyde dehydrogenase [Vibrio nigripulchritudo]BDU43089.1 aldehyde dehydrogenase [Vibrio nigripulchritudo]
MNTILTGKHYIGGNWLEGRERFYSAPTKGEPKQFYCGTAELVDKACEAAESAFLEYSHLSANQRADFLDAIAEELDLIGDDITEIGVLETGLPEPRLIGERGRTTSQLRLFAQHIREGMHLDIRKDRALPERKPLPRPELNMAQMPVGPVAVFGASNFPLAFSVVGGDTAAALAAGCTVVVKGHSAHPGVSELVATAVEKATIRCGIPIGTLNLVQGGARSVGERLVTHPNIQAVGFTGSLAGGRALFNLCAARPEPIPFFGELGSVNPVFVLKGALKVRAKELAQGWANSLTMGAGQFCTNPGVVVLVRESEGVEEFLQMAELELAETADQTMLTEGIASAYCEGSKAMSQSTGVEEIIAAKAGVRNAAPGLYITSGQNFIENEHIQEEVFGPLGLVLLAEDESEVFTIARKIKGQLTCTIHMEEADIIQAEQLLPVLQRKAGRILVNGFPTGVEVADAMVHGGPYPASTNFGATSVGTLSIRRFLRPVCFQNFPDVLLPKVFK